jgi:hypothetical protein
MLSNNQIRTIIGSQINNCTEPELSNIREFLTALASIEYSSYCEKREQKDAAKTTNLRDISN